MDKLETLVIRELTDYTHLNFSKTRHSSGGAGSFLKAFDIEDGKKYYYKLSNYDTVHGIVGHECLNEIIADRLLSVLEIPHLSYQLIYAKILLKNKIIYTYMCKSLDFKTPSDSKVALDAFYEMEALEGEKPMDFCIRMGWEEYIFNMLLIDYLILNRDRHGANIEVLKNKAKRTLNPAPLFDHGLSLCFSCNDDVSLQQVNPLEDKKIQSFMGSQSSYENLRLIPKEKLKKLPVFDSNLKKYLFRDLNGIISDIWIDTVWNFLKVRAKLYEDFCNK